MTRTVEEELKALRLQLSDARLRLSAIVEATVDGLVIIDEHGHIELFNPAAERIFGYASAEVVGRNVNVLMPAPYHDEHDGYMHNYLTTRVPKIIGIGREVQGQRKDGTIFPMDLAVGSFRSEGEERFVGMIRDITARKLTEASLSLREAQLHEAEAEARELREKLAHYNRLSTMGEMASGIAHEINQPLTAISAYAQACRRMLQTGDTGSGPLIDALEQVSAQAQRAGEVIRRLRGFVKKRESRKEMIDLADTLGAVVKLAEVDARTHRVQIRADISGPLPRVFADPVQIQQVALNLLRNAMEAIEANTDLAPEEREVLVRATTTEPSHVEVTVEDRGVGLPAEAERNLFTPFFTTKRTGMGMGLSISDSIVTAHGGRLWYAPHPRGGACFHFVLPIAIGAEHAEQ